MIYDAEIKHFSTKMARRKRPKRNCSHICLPRGICDFLAIPKLINGYQGERKKNEERTTKTKRTKKSRTKMKNINLWLKTAR